jgi:arginine N-succinyltransferase
MMGPLTPDSGTLLWEYLGRRFINLSYKEADLFSSRSKEFLLSLWPKGEIFASLLPPEARALIGKVGEETEPAKRMLEKQGFKYHGHVDPFDGGPYLDVAVGEVPLVKATSTARAVAGIPAGSGEAFVSHKGRAGFRATRSAFAHDGNRVVLPAETLEAIGAAPESTVGFTPLPESKPKQRRAKKS